VRRGNLIRIEWTSGSACEVILYEIFRAIFQARLDVMADFEMTNDSIAKLIDDVVNSILKRNSLKDTSATLAGALMAKQILEKYEFKKFFISAIVTARAAAYAVRTAAHGESDTSMKFTAHTGRSR
jgi:hypothetical protein